MLNQYVSYHVYLKNGQNKETFNKDLEELKRKQAMMNNTINEIKNTLEGINSRITEAEERKSDLEDKIVEVTTAEQEEKKKGSEKIFEEIIVENFPNMGKEIVKSRKHRG